MKILFVGFGDIAYRTAQLLDGHTLHGIARSVKPVPNGLQLKQGDLADKATLEWLSSQFWDAVVITLTPDGRDEQAYQQAYVDNCRRLVSAFVSGITPGHLLYVSSTGVYSQDNGCWIDEESPAQPAETRGELLLEAEHLIARSGMPHSIIRFSGIYGPGRDFLVRQVLQGKPGNEAYGNRIHQEDCAGFLAHTLIRIEQHLPVHELYLASDSQPSTGREVRQWLAEQLNVGLNGEPSSLRAGNKRCRNQRMLATGYCLKFPTYRDGYVGMLQDLRK